MFWRAFFVQHHNSVLVQSITHRCPLLIPGIFFKELKEILDGFVNDAISFLSLTQSRVTQFAELNLLHVANVSSEGKERIIGCLKSYINI